MAFYTDDQLNEAYTYLVDTYSEEKALEMLTNYAGLNPDVLDFAAKELSGGDETLDDILGCDEDDEDNEDDE